MFSNGCAMTYMSPSYETIEVNSRPRDQPLVELAQDERAEELPARRQVLAVACPDVVPLGCRHYHVVYICKMAFQAYLIFFYFLKISLSIHDPLSS